MEKKEDPKCKDCRIKLEVDLAQVAAITKLLDGKNNLLFTRTVTTTEEYRSDLGAALVASFISGQLPVELIGTAVETVGNLLASKLAAAEEAAKRK